MDLCHMQYRKITVRSAVYDFEISGGSLARYSRSDPYLLNIIQKRWCKYSQILIFFNSGTGGNTFTQ